MHAILKRSRPGPAPASLFHRPQPVVFLRQKVGNPGDYRTHTNAELRTRNSEPQAKVNSNSRTVACGFRTADARREATPEPAAAEPPLLHFRARRSLPAFGGGASGYPHTPPATPREATPEPDAAKPPLLQDRARRGSVGLSPYAPSHAPRGNAQACRGRAAALLQRRPAAGAGVWIAARSGSTRNTSDQLSAFLRRRECRHGGRRMAVSDRPGG
jgi:hypothetical protein